MIAKRIPMNSAKKSSFAGLVKYITSSQGINERVGQVRVTNCQTEELSWAVHEVLHTQKINTRAEGDKTYHLLISLAPGEQPSSEVLRDIEDRVCSAIGYQIISVSVLCITTLTVCTSTLRSTRFTLSATRSMSHIETSRRWAIYAPAWSLSTDCSR